MKVRLSYGLNGMDVVLPDTTHELRASHGPGLEDETTAICQAIRNPIMSEALVAKVKPGDRIAIVHTDITRATPNDRILPVLLDELESTGVSRKDITLINGLGTHRPQTKEELRLMLGDKIVDHYQCLQHDGHDDDNLVALGRTPMGHPVRINKHYITADIRILTGFIEPHFFAGFSGGPKGVLPALAGAESVLTNHGYDMISNPESTWGVTDGNPIWEEMRDVALMVNPTFLLNVTLNEEHQITGVFAGDMLAAHAEGCAYVRKTAMVGVDEAYDLVVTTNSGYPLDQNLYQTVKGMSAANQIVREGGCIIMVAACADGLPEHGQYAALLAQAGSPQGVMDLISQPGFSVQDQWQVQIQALIQQKADVYVYSDGLTDELITAALFHPCHNIEQMVSRYLKIHGPKTRIAVIPEGPQVIPYLMSEQNINTLLK